MRSGGWEQHPSSVCLQPHHCPALIWRLRPMTTAPMSLRVPQQLPPAAIRLGFQAKGRQRAHHRRVWQSRAKRLLFDDTL